MTRELMIFGYKAHLVVELDDGPHDISHLLKTPGYPQPQFPVYPAFCIDSTALINEIETEKRARRRAAEKAS